MCNNNEIIATIDNKQVFFVLENAMKLVSFVLDKNWAAAVISCFSYGTPLRSLLKNQEAGDEGRWRPEGNDSSWDSDETSCNICVGMIRRRLLLILNCENEGPILFCFCRYSVWVTKRTWCCWSYAFLFTQLTVTNPYLSEGGIVSDWGVPSHRRQ